MPLQINVDVNSSDISQQYPNREKIIISLHTSRRTLRLPTTNDWWIIYFTNVKTGTLCVRYNRKRAHLTHPQSISLDYDENTRILNLSLVSTITPVVVTIINNTNNFDNEFNFHYQFNSPTLTWNLEFNAPNFYSNFTPNLDLSIIQMIDKHINILDKLNHSPTLNWKLSYEDTIY